MGYFQKTGAIQRLDISTNLSYREGNMDRSFCNSVGDVLKDESKNEFKISLYFDGKETMALIQGFYVVK